MRGVCSSEKKNEDRKTCHAALIFIPNQEKIPIAEIGLKKDNKKKFGLSPGIPADILFDVENWLEAVHRHRGNYHKYIFAFFYRIGKLKINSQLIVRKQLMKMGSAMQPGISLRVSRQDLQETLSIAQFKDDYEKTWFI